jgi:hypothetical protein
MRFGVPISLLLHALILGWGLIAMKSTRDFKKPDIQPIALEIITADELAQMRKGDDKSKELEAKAAKDAQGKAEKDPPKPKVAVAAPPPPPPPPPPEPEPEPAKEEPKPDPIKEKIEQAAKEPEPPKPPEPKPPEVKPPEPPKPEPKPEAADALAAMKENEPKPPAPALPPLPPAKPPEPPKAVEKPKPPPPPKPKPAPKVAEAKPAPAPPRPTPPANKPSSFDEQMRKAGLAPEDAPPDPLLDKDPRRKEAAKSVASAAPASPAKTAAGSRDGQGQKVSQSEVGRLAAELSRQIKECYRAQGGNAVDREELMVKLRFDLATDGMLRGEPVVLEAARFSLATQWAVNALKGCQPYKLDADKYQAWKEWDFTFRP